MKKKPCFRVKIPVLSPLMRYKAKDIHLVINCNKLYLVKCLT